MKVSIITVTYNPDIQDLRDTIQSVIKQKFEDYEYIIIDGGSRREVLNVFEEFKNNIDILVSEADKGIYDAMNKGISLASGEIVAILNAGDWFVDEKVLQIIVDEFDNDADVLCGTMIQEMKNGFKLSESIKPDNDNLIKTMILSHPATYVRKDIYDKYGLFDISFRIAADHELMMRYYSRGVRIKTSKSVFTFFAYGGASTNPLKIIYKEDERIAVKYGMNPFRAYILRLYRSVRYLILTIVRYLKIDNIIKKVLKQVPNYSKDELKSMGYNLEKKWFYS